MRTTLMEYLKTYGKKTFQEAPFSQVDALLLCDLSYLKMKGIVKGFHQRDFMTWKEIKQHPDFEKLFTDIIYGPTLRKVFFLTAASTRYRNIKIGYFQEWFDEEKELQFAAVTFLLGKSSIFVAYRGTDDSLIGWKEDFNLGYLPKIPSQKHALDYLKGVARHTTGRLVLGGHSKGGNLAVYAASYASENIQSRIRRIYSFDGVGFKKEFYEKEGFLRVADRLYKIVPEQSLIGMLFSNHRGYRIVESYKSGLAQHDLMFWKIRDGKFVYRSNLRRKSRLLAAKVNAWINSFSLPEISSFVNTLYELLLDDSPKNAKVYVGKIPRAKVKSVYTKFKSFDKSRKKEFIRIILTFFRTHIFF